MSKTRRSRYSGIFPFLLLSCCVIGSCASRSTPNIVLISIDTLRPDRLSCYGAPRPTSPVIDVVAEKSARFTSAFSTSPWTLPAHASMLTGRYPSTLAHDPNALRIDRVAPMLSSLLQETGYTTAAVTGGGWLIDDLGFSRGFDYFKDRGHVTDAVEWINRNHERRFFLFYHTYVVHAPYHYREFAKGNVAGRFEPIFSSKEDGGELYTDICCRGVEVTPTEREFVLALYDGGVKQADGKVAELLRALQKFELIRNTIIIITSDHGEEFWEHTGRGAYHGHTLYDELLRIPLIWFDPAIESASREISTPVSLVDIVPTLLARIGVEAPGPLDGESLLPLLSGADWASDRVLFSEAVRHGPYRYSVRSPGATLIITPDAASQHGEGIRYPVPVLASRELYLSGDAMEQRNAISTQSPLEGALSSALERHLAKRAPRSSEDEAVPLDEEAIEHLQSLGYLR